MPSKVQNLLKDIRQINVIALDNGATGGGYKGNAV